MSPHLQVWIVKTHLTLQDPDLPGPRYHTTIFVETNSTEGNGFVHQVIGDVTSEDGMYYNKEISDKPEASEAFFSKEHLGYTDAATYPDEFDKLLGGIPAPPQQKAFKIKTMKTEPFKTRHPLTFYEPGEAQRPVVKCTEWTEQAAIPTLRQAGLIRSIRE